MSKFLNLTFVTVDIYFSVLILPAIFSSATSGPNFGATDLQIGPPKAAVMGGFAGPDQEDISINAGSLRQCRAYPGLGYDTDKRWPVRGQTALVEVEAYCQRF